MKLAPHIDTVLLSLINKETRRQQEQITLIASENYASPAVMAATGSSLTNKYAEGYPGKRYYAGCAWVDAVETLAIDRCKQLFGAPHANVQPHAGSQANMAVYCAALKPGDTILGMSLSEGGHLTHGHKVNFSGLMYKSVQYQVNKDTELLDYDEIERLAHIHKPQIIVAGASAYSRIIDFARFAHIARSVGAFFMADIAHIAGLVATGYHPTPIGYADFVTSTTHKTLRGPRGGLIMTTVEHAQAIDRAIMPGTQGGPFLNSIAGKAAAFYEALQPDFSAYQKQVLLNARAFADAMTDLGYRIVAGGTDNHLFIVDLRSKHITGHDAAVALEKAGIIVSKSGIPFDLQKPWITSGIRIGTPAVTTRGMQEAQMRELAQLIDDVIAHKDSEVYLAAVAQQIKKLCAQFVVYEAYVHANKQTGWEQEL